MDFGALSKNKLPRSSIFPLITFGLIFSLAMMNFYQYTWMSDMQQILHDKHSLFKKCAGEKAADAAKAGHGSLYTRWGRKTCPDTAELVYEGLVGGQHHDISGGGSNLLCLPHGPIWANTTKKFEDTATIYGSGYQFEAYATDPLFSFENAEKLNDHVAPCAVCVTRKPAAVMMLPGRTKCCSGWTIEYYGYLMSECDNGKGRHDYVCVDYAPETCPDIYVNKNGSSLHFVQTTNYTMPYQMYESGRELTCVVCSKY